MFVYMKEGRDSISHAEFSFIKRLGITVSKTLHHFNAAQSKSKYKLSMRLENSLECSLLNHIAVNDVTGSIFALHIDYSVLSILVLIRSGRQRHLRYQLVREYEDATAATDVGTFLILYRVVCLQAVKRTLRSHKR
jgi:hypothetical protein